MKLKLLCFKKFTSSRSSVEGLGMWKAINLQSSRRKNTPDLKRGIPFKRITRYDIYTLLHLFIFQKLYILITK